MKVRANMINSDRTRAREIELMRALFKLGLLTDLWDDIALSNSTLFRHKDRQVINGFKAHFKNKFKDSIEGLFDLELRTDNDILDPMKARMEAIMDEVLDTELTFDKLD